MGTIKRIDDKKVIYADPGHVGVWYGSTIYGSEIYTYNKVNLLDFSDFIKFY